MLVSTLIRHRATYAGIWESEATIAGVKQIFDVMASVGGIDPSFKCRTGCPGRVRNLGPAVAEKCPRQPDVVAAVNRRRAILCGDRRRLLRAGRGLGDIFGGGLGDLFDAFFGGGGSPFGGGGGGGRVSNRGEDLETTLQIDLEEAVFGGHHDVTIRTAVACDSCEATSGGTSTSGTGW